MTEETKESTVEEVKSGVEASVEASAKKKSCKEKAKVCKAKMCATWVKNKKLIVAVIVLIVIVLASFGYTKYFKKIDIGVAGATGKVNDFIKNNAPNGGQGVAIKSVTKDAASGLYQVTITANKQDVVTYITPDGTKLFLQTVDLTAQKQTADASQQSAPAKAADVPKSAVPDVRLFVMSYCPYGTQMEKGILPVLNTLGSKIKYTLEFVNYSMHNDIKTNDRKELDENLRQYCIQKNQPTKLNAYLTCFLKAGQGTEASCEATAGVNAAQVATCMAQTDTQFNVTKDFNDQSSYQGNFPQFEVNAADNTKYGVQGSPTLVINGVQADAQRDPASILKTICGAFTNAPKECSATLSGAAGAPGFGGTAAASSNGSVPAASCTTPQN